VIWRTGNPAEILENMYSDYDISIKNLYFVNMELDGIQKQFFNHLKSTLPKHLSLADSMGEILGLSQDSVYRRIRGEKPITLDEIKILCEHFHISLDQVLQLKSNTVVFLAPGLEHTNTDFTQYLKGMLSWMNNINSHEKREMFYLSKDVPIFHFFHYPELAQFKTFFWKKSIINHPDYENALFTLDNFEKKEEYALGQSLIKAYNELPSTEIWNMECINSTVNQIEYYREAGLFERPEDASIVLESYEKTLNHIKVQGEKGRKFLKGMGEAGYRAPLKLYVNELILGNNTILVEINGRRISFVTYNVLDYLHTSDPRFNDVTFSNFHTLASRSTLISETGERERNRFFNSLRKVVMK